MTSAGCLLRIVAYVAAYFAAFIVVAFGTGYALERLLVSAVYGREAYSAGLRIIDQQWNLSNGTALPWRWRIVYILVLGPTVAGLMYVAHRLIQRAFGLQPTMSRDVGPHDSEASA
jgi:hypothetical protein